MEIREVQKAFEEQAAMLGDYQLMTKTELANGYCDADEAARQARSEGNLIQATTYESIRSQYFSALMLRYWYKIFEWAQNSSSLHLDYVDFVDWLSDSFYVVFYYRVWRYEYEAIVRHGIFEDWKYDEDGNRIPNKYYWRTDPNAPDKIINRCCGSMRGRVYQYNNKDKRKAAVQTFSLDVMIEEGGDSVLGNTGCYVEDSLHTGTYYLISEFINRQEIIEALVVDGIANHDTYKTHKDTIYVKERDAETGTESNVAYTHNVSTFDARKLVKHLSNMSQVGINQFCINYSIPLADAENIYAKLKKLSNPKLYKYIQKTLTEIKQTPHLLDCLI